jgi:hypothetical protein
MKENCPFHTGKRYRIKRDYTYLNHAFKQGEDVVFSTYSYSPKEGLRRYWFRSILSGETNIWHVSDDDPKNSWNEMFEERDEA